MIAELKRFAAVYRNMPTMAWVIVLNPVWGRFEDYNVCAIFDTEEQAKAYEIASRLPQVTRTEDGINRTYRPDSLLYDYNPCGPCCEPMLIRPVSNPLFEWTCLENPEPPSGPVPEMRLLAHPRYGRDYDIGNGLPRSDMSKETPLPGGGYVAHSQDLRLVDLNDLPEHGE